MKPLSGQAQTASKFPARYLTREAGEAGRRLERKLHRIGVSAGGQACLTAMSTGD